jgi:glycine/D-amino acid oxidase-like deaminating enzyme
MKRFDWIVIGAGITGTALAYELAKRGASVCLVEQHRTLQGATRYSYGGISYWAGTTPLTQQLCAEGIALHRQLSQELEYDTEFRELPLIMPIVLDEDPATIAATYADCAIVPRLISAPEAFELEPLLNPAAMEAALVVHHAHLNPVKGAQAYTQALHRLGGTTLIAQLTNWQFSDRTNTISLTTTAGELTGENLVICAGALSRHLLKQAGIHVQQYFSHAELIETVPVSVQLRSLIMAANIQRFRLETQAAQPQLEALWDEPGHELVQPILDAGVIQFSDGHLRMGQISRTVTQTALQVDAAASETWLRSQVGQLLPRLGQVQGTWHTCSVAYSRDHLPLIGPIPYHDRVQIFSGFSNPMVLVPPLARRFAAHLMETPDPLLAQLSPDRFAEMRTP